MTGFQMEFLTTTELGFKCQCSKERLEDVLLNLNRDDMLSLIEDGQAEVCCQFCGAKYNLPSRIRASFKISRLCKVKILTRIFFSAIMTNAMCK